MFPQGGCVRLLRLNCGMGEVEGQLCLVESVSPGHGMKMDEVSTCQEVPLHLQVVSSGRRLCARLNGKFNRFNRLMILISWVM